VTEPRSDGLRVNRNDKTLAVYEQRAVEWKAQRTPRLLDRAAAFSARVEPGTGPVIDLGCGPGWYAAGFGAEVVALDGARSMLDLVADEAPSAWRVQADLASLPFGPATLGGAWACRSYVHLARSALPLALADLHRAMRVGAPVDLHLFGGDLDHGQLADDDFAGRCFSAWTTQHLVDVVVGAGFEINAIDRQPSTDQFDPLVVTGSRARTLADTVGPGMRLLICGLNPSEYSADVGIGFGRAGNRYWAAALAAGIVSRDRDPRAALIDHGVGMTDLVKRPTPRADALSSIEYRTGLERVTRSVDWLRPGAVCFVGLAGWRAAVDRKAVAGVQPDGLGSTPVYVMPSTSGLNARTTPAELADHLRAAAWLADS
jgi:TDG/mug DNA glycosylase family protein